MYKEINAQGGLMMSEAVQVALVSGLCVAIPTIIVNLINNSTNRKLMEYRLNVLEEKQDKHNDIIQRTYILEEKVKVVNHRLDDLEHH